MSSQVDEAPSAKRISENEEEEKKLQIKSNILYQRTWSKKILNYKWFKFWKIGLSLNKFQ